MLNAATEKPSSSTPPIKQHSCCACPSWMKILVAITVVALVIFGTLSFLQTGQLSHIGDIASYLAYASWGVAGVLVLGTLFYLFCQHLQAARQARRERMIQEIVDAEYTPPSTEIVDAIEDDLYGRFFDRLMAKRQARREGMN